MQLPLVLRSTHARRVAVLEQSLRRQAKEIERLKQEILLLHHERHAPVDNVQRMNSDGMTWSSLNKKPLIVEEARARRASADRDATRAAPARRSSSHSDASSISVSVAAGMIDGTASSSGSGSPGSCD